MAATQEPSAELAKGLAEVFVETLKEMAGAGERLAPEAIARILAKNPKLGKILERQAPAAARTGGLGGDLEVLEKRLAKVTSQKEALTTRTKVLETQANRKNDMLTRALLTVVRLVDPDQHPHVFQPLNDFRQAILAGEDALDLEERLRRLKEVILKGSAAGAAGGAPAPAPKSTSLLGRFFGKGRGAPAPQTQQQDEVWVCTTGDPTVQLKEIYLELLAEFQVDLGQDYLGKLHELMRRVNEADDPDYLLTLRVEVAGLLRTYVHKVGKERAEATHFIAELLQRLAFLYEQVVASQKETEEANHADDQFAANLGSKIEEVAQSAANSQALDQLRDMILARMGDFRTALREKNLADQVRRRKIKKIMLAMRDEVMASRTDVARMHQENLNLQMKLLTDPLTGVYNRRALRERLDEAFAKAKAGGATFSVALCDLDHFKQVNDTYGHSIGDELLKELAKRLTPQLREADTLARYGGDEFVAVMVGADLTAGAAIAEKLKQAIEQVDFQVRGKKLPITLTVGVSQVRPEDNEVRLVIDRADKALYKAKSEGKNRVGVF